VVIDHAPGDIMRLIDLARSGSGSRGDHRCDPGDRSEERDGRHVAATSAPTVSWPSQDKKDTIPPEEGGDLMGAV